MPKPPNTWPSKPNPSPAGTVIGKPKPGHGIPSVPVIGRSPESCAPARSERLAGSWHHAVDLGRSEA